MSPPLWLQITYDWSQIATPLIALFGFIFVYKQIGIAKDQFKVMRKQLELELEARKSGHTPYFDLQIPTGSNDGHWVTYNFSLTNAGLAPAFQVKVGYIQNKAEDTITNMEFAAVTIGASVKFSLKFPMEPRETPLELYVKYRNIYSDEFYQSWIRSHGNFKPQEPPKLTDSK